jgi:hypothetical protein
MSNLAAQLESIGQRFFVRSYEAGKLLRTEMSVTTINAREEEMVYLYEQFSVF